jgi:hypothetical protein
MGPVHGWDCAGAGAVERRKPHHGYSLIEKALHRRNILAVQRR